MAMPKKLSSHAAIALCVASSAALSEEPTYGGVSSEGLVRIAEDASVMYADYNVRFDPWPGHENSRVVARITQSLVHKPKV